MEPKVAKRAPFVMEMEPGTYYWCRCGHSQSQPFCDGAHKALGNGMAPLKVELTEPKKVAWCGCKHSANASFCDGSHKRVPEGT